MRNWAFVVLLVAVNIFGQEEELYKLNIIHYNDFHAHYDEVSWSGGTCDAAQRCIGGLSRLSTAIREALEAEPDSLLLNGGDTFQGTVWYNFLRWNVSQHFMNLLPKHDAHVLGNHEFDHGLEGLLPYLERLRDPMLGANVNTTFEPELGQYVNNYVIVERNNRRIGIIGVLLTKFSANIGKLVIEDELEAINREAKILTDLGVDIIIVLSHMGFFTDQELAAKMSPSVDIIVGAHTHTLLYNGDPPFGTSRGSYPTLVTQDNGHTILIVQASSSTYYLGNITLWFNKEGVIKSWEGQPMFLGSSVVKDSEMETELERWRAELYPLSREVLGRALVPLRRSSCYTGECNLGSWLCDVFLDKMVSLAEGKNWNYVNLCLINSGGLRANIGIGDVTTENLLKALPFENKIQVFDVKGKYILEAIEFGAGADQEDPSSFYSYNMLQFGGIRVVLNASLASGSRVVSASVRCKSCAVPRYHPLDPEATYAVVTQNYLGNGGDGYTMLADHRENVQEFDLEFPAIQDFMRKTEVFFQDLDGRLQIVY